LGDGGAVDGFARVGVGEDRAVDVVAWGAGHAVGGGPERWTVAREIGQGKEKQKGVVSS
jgi:hypothetical protein